MAVGSQAQETVCGAGPGGVYSNGITGMGLSPCVSQLLKGRFLPLGYFGRPPPWRILAKDRAAGLADLAELVNQASRKEASLKNGWSHSPEHQGSWSRAMNQT